MEAKKEKRAHTPGPWEKATIGIGTNSKQVVWLGENTGKQVQVIGTGRDHANARLIAAAPELLEQCKFLERMLVTTGHHSSNKLAKVREVLAKVEGGEE